MRAIQGLQLWASRLTPPPFRLVQIGSAYWQSRALGVATELDVASQLGDDTLAIGVLAQRCNVVPDGLQRVLRLLAALGVFEEAQPGHWRNNRGSAPLRADRPGSVRDLVLLHQRPEMRAPWSDTLASALRLGRPAFEVSHGQPLFEHMATDPALEEAFAKAMAQVEGLTGTPWVDAIDWRAFHRLLDVGGSAGDKALTLLARHAHLHALVIDRPATVAAARFLRASETDPQRSAARARLSFHAADVRQDALPPASSAKDVFWLSALLHGMSDADALRVLQRVARAAAPVGATVLVMEAVRNEETADLAVSGMDLQMAVCTEGRERSLREWQGLFAQARLQLRERVPLPMLAEIMVLTPL
ncbi:methyltransferase [Acidovorax kalamii]|uniref:methyltransferase n=1 Tax=Acidovorax kalamii TaxID=2004485 RepID=UPI0020900670|nr:methyltransferase [Acidovorax kalamii]MCO5356699.1 methyltransferase [Acidovorax kalamii]